MTFASPLALVALVAVPLAAAVYAAFHTARASFAERFASAAMFPNVVDRSPGWRRHVPVGILLLGLATLLVGFARPHAMVSGKRENATIVLALDTSRSMAAVDVRPSRLAVVKTVVEQFVKQVPAKYRIGVVGFSSQPEVAAPATRNRAVILRALSQLAPGGATALADGIVTALNVGLAVQREQPAGARPAELPPVSVVVFSDGVQEGGEVTAAQAVARARAFKIPVSAVLVGTAYGIVRVPRVGGFVQFIRVPTDPSELRTITKVTHGHFYVGPRTADLSQIYRELHSRLGTVRKQTEVTFAFGIAAVALLLVGGSLSAVWLRRVP
jgi:Ca-activated chloride channel family protein